MSPLHRFDCHLLLFVALALGACGGAASPATTVEPTASEPAAAAAAKPKAVAATDRPSNQAPKEIEQATPAGRVAVSGPIYTHPLGVRFRYPEGWRLQEVEEGVLSLVPTDVHSNEFGALELFLVVGDSADGLTSAQDPQVGGLLDSMMATFPFLQRQGKARRIELAGRAHAEYAWSGTNDQGNAFEGRAWASIVDGFALAVIGITPKERLAQRQPMLQAIASTFHWQAPPVDRRLVGNWSNENHYSAGTGYSGTLARYLQFRPDGSCYWSSRAFALLSTSDTSGNYSGTQMRDTGAPKDASSGRWTATGSELRMLWDSGQSDHYTFEQSGDSLLLIDKADGQKRLWSR